MELTQEEITTGIEVIAEFMDSLTVDMHGNIKEDLTSFKYHSSWDWLMPVVERIEKMPLHELIYKTSSSRFPIVYMYQDRCIIKDTGDQTIANVFDGRGRLMATYGAVIEFIIWYNLNNKNNFN